MRIRRPHNLQVGDIVWNSWGYDQTNIDYYQVVKATAHFVWLRELNTDIASIGAQAMDGKVTPKPNDFKGEKVTKQGAYMSDYHVGEPEVCFGYGCGWKWDGQAKGCSWYA